MLTHDPIPIFLEAERLTGQTNTQVPLSASPPALRAAHAEVGPASASVGCRYILPLWMALSHQSAG
jgi:hypothetical protein